MNTDLDAAMHLKIRRPVTDRSLRDAALGYSRTLTLLDSGLRRNDDLDSVSAAIPAWECIRPTVIGTSPRLIDFGRVSTIGE